MGRNPYGLICSLLAALAAALCLGPVGLAGAAEAPTPAECEEAQGSGIPLEGCPVITNTTLSSSPNPASTGQAVVYTATVKPIPDGGIVEFTDLSGTSLTNCGAVAVDTTSGQATCAITYASAGDPTIQASYSGDAGFRSSKSALFTQVIEAPIVIPPSTQTSVALSSSKSPAPVSGAVTYTATITPAPPGGTVEFTDSQISIPSCRAVDIAAVNAQSAVATCRVKYTIPGTHQLRAIYSGEGHFLGAESTPFGQVVSGSTNALLAKLSGSRALHGGSVRASFTCTSVGGACKITATLTTVPRRGGKAARTAASDSKAKTRAVTVGASTVSIAPGKSAEVTVKLNGTGRRLLARLGTLVVKLTVTVSSNGAHAKVASRTLTIGSPHAAKRRRH